jgi:ankyrin repeat protein
MIEEVIVMRKANRAGGWNLLEGVLKKLKNGKNANINKKGISGWTALHFAVELKKLSVVKVLLDRNADVNLRSNGSFTPFHLALILRNFDAALLLLNSNKISQVNLEAAVMNEGKETALAYARRREVEASQTNWRTIINALQAAGATK